MTYTVTITSPVGEKHTFACAGAADQDALIYAGKVVEKVADAMDPSSSVTIERNGEKIGPTTTLSDMIGKAEKRTR